MKSDVNGPRILSAISKAATTMFVAGCFAIIANQAFAQAPPGMNLVWSDEFNGGVGSTPNGANWGYDTGAGGWGNNEQETYVTSQANAHIISDGTGTDNL